MKFVFLSFIFLFIGSMLGRHLFPLEKSLERAHIQPSIIKQESPVETKAITVVNNKSLKEAKELYGKAFNLFLANLSLKLDQNKKDELKRLMNDPQDFLDTTKENSQTEVFIPREIDFTPTDWFKNFIQKEKADFKNVNDDDLIQQAQKFILKDPALYYARSALYKDFPKIKKILGEYKANTYFIAGKDKGKVDQVYLNIDFQLKNEKDIKGNFTLKLSRDDKVYSNSSGAGSNGDVRFKGKSIIIQSGPGRFFHFLNENIDIANFYDENKLVGFARFSKQ